MKNIEELYAVIINGVIYDTYLDITEANEILDNFEGSNIGLILMTELD